MGKINEEYVGVLTKQFIRDFKKPNLRYACKWLDQHHEDWIGKYYDFDYPEYCGLPEHISSKLMSDEVDYLQDMISRDNFKRMG